MRTLLLAALPALLLGGLAFAGPTPRLFQAGTGVPNPLPRDERAMWSEPPDLNGLIGSSEQILVYGLETEIANDFIPSDSIIARAAFWGGYYNNELPCRPGIPTPGFHFRFYDGSDCDPYTQPFADLSITRFIEEPVGCQMGLYPLYKWTGDVNVHVTPGNRYWFSAQFADHDFPPQGGRLASAQVVNCESVYKIVLNWPEWVPVGDVFGVHVDFSQEFNGILPDAPGACCLSDGHCSIITSQDCMNAGGTWLGPGAVCDPNPCGIGACCAADGSCSILRQAGCIAPAQWQGVGTYCFSNTCGAREPGSIAGWGSNWTGQCEVPQPNRNFIATAAGADHNLGLTANGTVLGWGWNYFHQCDVPAPNSDFVAVAAGFNHSLGLESSGSIRGWGDHTYRQIYVPAPNSDFMAIAAGGDHSLGLKTDGSVMAWGRNYDHECDVPAPNTGFVAIAAGDEHSLGLKVDGSIVAWGQNTYGQCSVPQVNTGFVAVAAGGAHSLGLKADGSVVAWGDDRLGQCEVPGPNTGFISIAGGLAHSIGLRADGSIVAWGYNGDGEGNVPAPNTGFVAISAGASHSLGLARLPNGACCRPEGICNVTIQDDCAALGGTYQGDDTVCAPDPCEVSSTETGGTPPSTLSLRAAPNPSGGRTVLLYDLPRAGDAGLEVFDAGGSIVRRLSLGDRPAGRYSIPWDGRDNDGRRLPAGVYLTRITTKDAVTTGRLVLLGR